MLDKIIYPFLLALTGVGYLMLLCTKILKFVTYPIKCVDWYIIGRKLSYIKFKIKGLLYSEK